jgi:hypothetical protein
MHSHYCRGDEREEAMRSDFGSGWNIIGGLRAVWQRTARKAAGRVTPSKIAGLLARMRPLTGIGHHVTDAEMHRQSARAVMQAYHQGTL